MGSCVSEARKDEVLDEELKNDGIEDRKIYKVLLIGPGGSGKQTFMQQLRDIHRNNENNSLMNYVPNNKLVEIKLDDAHYNGDRYQLINPWPNRNLDPENLKWRKHLYMFSDVTAIIFIADLCLDDIEMDKNDKMALIHGYCEMYYDIEKFPADLFAIITEFCDMNHGGK